MDKSRIELVRGDITEERVDAIVNAANTDLLLGAGVAGAIRRNGGPSIQSECDAHGAVELGGAALTGAGDLPARYVIHAAAMYLGGAPTADSIRMSTIGSLQIAADRRFEVISFPALGTGVGGFPVAEAAGIMLKAVGEHLEKNEYPRRVRFVLFDEATRIEFERVSAKS